tara:strand:+ start:149 stop:292 length:144 start_codon:yes stop_codon:yes gene_type:complete
MAGTSIKKLMNKLKKPAVANDVLHKDIAFCKSDFTSFSTVIYLPPVS